MDIGTIGSMIGHRQPDDNGRYRSPIKHPVQPSSHQNHGRYHAISMPMVVASPRFTKASDQGVACDSPPFVASASFTGRKDGYVFQTGDQGLGYYPDRTQLTPRTNRMRW